MHLNLKAKGVDNFKNQGIVELWFFFPFQLKNNFC